MKAYGATVLICFPCNNLSEDYILFCDFLYVLVTVKI